MNTKTKNESQKQTDKAHALKKLGLVIEVRFLSPTGQRGGRWVAEIISHEVKCRKTIGFHHHNTDEATRLEVAEQCLAEFNAQRAAWWKAYIKEGEWKPFVLHSTAYTPAAHFYFAS